MRNDVMPPQSASSTGWAKIGVTHRGADCETKAALDHHGYVWIADGEKWLRCYPLVIGYFSPNDQTALSLDGGGAALAGLVAEKPCAPAEGG